jgi:hypothetical protein
MVCAAVLQVNKYIRHHTARNYSDMLLSHHQNAGQNHDIKIANIESCVVIVLFPSNGRFFQLYNSCVEKICHNVLN